jgi:hypothetical protein
MRRILFYRLYNIEPAHLSRVDAEAQAFGRSRDWRGDRFWLASPRSTDLFSMEYFRHARNEEGSSLSAAGFLRLLGDETDAIATLYFLNDSTQRYHARAKIQDEDNPIAKLRAIEIEDGRLPTGMPIEDVLAARPVIKRMREGAITFYPPTYHPNPYYRRDKPGMWGFSLQGMRDFAPTFLEAEAEAMRIFRGLGRLNRD